MSWAGLFKFVFENLQVKQNGWMIVWLVNWLVSYLSLHWLITWSLLLIWHYKSMKLGNKIVIIMLFVLSWCIDWSLERVSFVSIVKIRCQVTCEKRWNQTFVNKFVKVCLFEFFRHNKFNISGLLSENDFLCWVTRKNGTPMQRWCGLR